MDVAPGTIIGARFRVTGFLAEGGMGKVYRAELCSLGKPVAIKILRAELARDRSNVHRFLREARAASALSHPNLVSVLDFGRLETGEPYLAMEVCNGVTLQEILRDGAMAPPRVAGLFDSILSAVAEAHACGILHLDLKPANVIVDRWRNGTEFPRVIDFGIARIAGEVAVEGEHAVGTPRYVAPEILRNEEPDARTDVYALGVMLYECLAGRPPFEGTLPEILDGHLHRPPPPLPAGERSGAARAIEVVARRAMEKRREDRHPTAGAMRASLREAAELAPSGAIASAPADADSTRARSVTSTRRGARAAEVTPWALATGTPTGDMPPVPSSGVMRRAALDALLELIAPVRPGRRIGIVSPDGGGATYLLRNALSRIESDTVITVLVEGDVTGASRPLYPLLRALGDLLGVRTTSPKTVAEYAASRGIDHPVLEALRSLSGAPSQLDPLPPDVRAREIEAAILSFFRRLAPRTLLVFDGVSRYDAASVRVLRRLLHVPDLGACVCVAAPATSPFGRADFDEIVSLDELSPGDAQAVLAADTGAPPPPLPSGMPRLPLFLIQVAHALAAGIEPGGCSFAELIGHRLARLSPHERETLVAAAVWGRAGTVEGLAALVGGGINVALPLVLLARAGFLSTAADEGRWEFHHPLVHEATYEAIPIGRRRALHVRARDLATRLGLVEEVVLHHAIHATEPSLVQVRAQVRRAALLTRGLDIEAAVTTLGEAYRVARSLSAEEEARGELLEVASLLTDALLRARRPALAEAIAVEVAPEAAGSLVDEARRLRDHARALAQRGSLAQAGAAYTRLLRSSTRGSRKGMPALYVEAAAVAERLDGPLGALGLLEEGVNALSPRHGLTPPPDVPVGDLWMVALAYAAASRVCGAASASRFASRAARTLAARSGNLRGEAEAALEQARCAPREAGAEIATFLDDAFRLALRASDHWLAAAAAREQGRQAAAQGRSVEAATHAEIASRLEGFLDGSGTPPI